MSANNLFIELCGDLKTPPVTGNLKINLRVEKLLQFVNSETF